MRGYIANIEQITIENTDFRRVLYTAKHSQLVLMSIAPNDDIGEETHHLDQFLRIEAGTGKAILYGVETEIADGSAIVVPAGCRHNFVNTSSTDPLKLYTVYSPPEHVDGTIRATKADAIAQPEEFDGKTTE